MKLVRNKKTGQLFSDKDPAYMDCEQVRILPDGVTVEVIDPEKPTITKHDLICAVEKVCKEYVAGGSMGKFLDVGKLYKELGIK